MTVRSPFTSQAWRMIAVIVNGTSCIVLSNPIASTIRGRCGRDASAATCRISVIAPSGARLGPVVSLQEKTTPVCNEFANAGDTQLNNQSTRRGRIVRPSATFATLVTFVAVMLSVLFAPAGPAGAVTNAQATLDGLEAQGYDLTIDRIGSGPMDECIVTSVRNPNTITRVIKDYYGPKDKNG